VGNTGQSKAGGLVLNTGGAAIGLIIDKGNVGIGTATPANKLEVAGPGNVAFNNSGNVGIGTDNPSQKLDVSGKIFASQDVCIASGACLSQINDFIGSQKLIGSVHTYKQCTEAGGEVVNIGLASPICRFTAPYDPAGISGYWQQFGYSFYLNAQCPSSWFQYLNWSTTEAYTCRGCWWGCYGYCCGGWTACTTGSHTWGNVAAETCPYRSTNCGGGMCYAPGNPTCSATISRIGCY
jgi:hypothetical protein